MKLLIVFSICISATVVFLILLFNISNTTYYRSHEEIDVIVAGGKKDLKSFKYAESLSYIQIHNNNEQLLKQFDDLEILIKNNDKIFLIKLMDIKTNDLKNFQINNDESRYMPVGYPDNANQYDFEGITIILDRNNNKFLGARISGSDNNNYFLKRGKITKKIPIKISELQDLFGMGEVFNSFIH